MTSFALLVHEDHHQELVFQLYRRTIDAIAAAKDIYADEVAYRDGKQLPIPDPDDADNQLTDEMKAAGWIYYGRYQDEHGDNVRVITIELI